LRIALALAVQHDRSRVRIGAFHVQAIVMEEFGPPEVLVLREVADPVCGPGQVMIEVSFSSVTFVETQVRSGRAPRVSMLPRLPAVPGNGVAGVVVAVGSGVGNDVIGARVVSTTGGTGGYAQLVSVPADGVIPIPGEVAPADAAALLADGRTALGLLDRATIEPGATVLVEAAAGGVGSLLVQLAKRAGAFVVAAAGDERKLELARSLGADVAVDYGRGSWTDEVTPATTARGSMSSLTASAARSAATHSTCSGPVAASARSAWHPGASRRSANRSSQAAASRSCAALFPTLVR
jgi:NADPH:quinone reductase